MRSGSQEVCWWATHLYVSALIAQTENLPAAGTPCWGSLADDDPNKLLALAIAGEHHVLRVETAQAAQAQAGQAISAALDWGAVARSNFRHARAVAAGIYIPLRPREIA